MYPQLTKKSLNYPHGTRCEKDICIKLVQNVGYVILLISTSLTIYLFVKTINYNWN